MKEIQILSTPRNNSLYDEHIGYYIVKKDGETDIVLLSNYRYKKIHQENMKNDVVKYSVVEVYNDVEYVVKPLDNINKVATMFNVTSEEIKRKNNLKDDRLFIGQIIKI